MSAIWHTCCCLGGTFQFNILQVFIFEGLHQGVQIQNQQSCKEHLKTQHAEEDNEFIEAKEDVRPRGVKVRAGLE